MKKILQNKLVSLFIFPLSLGYFLYTGIKYYFEYKAIRKAINKNDSFSKALLTLDFKGHKYLPAYFYCEKEVDDNLSLTEIQDIAQKQIINIIIKYLKSEDLLTILSVDTEVHDGKVLFSLQPASLQLTIVNSWNLIQSIILHLILVGFYYVFI